MLTGDRGLAEDLVQECLIRVYQRWRSLEGAPEAFAHRVLVNLAIDGWRQRRRKPEDLTAAHTEAPAAAERVDEAIATRLHLVGLLRQLPARQRVTVFLRYVEDRSEAETADLLGVSVGTIKSAASRGLAQLRSLTEHDDASKGAQR